MARPTVPETIEAVNRIIERYGFSFVSPVEDSIFLWSTIMQISFGLFMLNNQTDQDIQIIRLYCKTLYNPDDLIVEPLDNVV